ncbi:MAG: HlyD family type I secretion periplasmic adaptor subunit [Pseudomonadota bacterium]
MTGKLFSTGTELSRREETQPLSQSDQEAAENRSLATQQTGRNELAQISQDNFPPPREGVFSYDYRTAGRGPMRLGYLVLIPFLLIAGGWTIVAPIHSAAIASGAVVLDDDRKTIQHLEGGIVDEILVSEGQAVEANQPILAVRDFAERTELDGLHEQLANARAVYLRLLAERADQSIPDFASLSTGIDLPADKVAKLKDIQTKLFESRQQSVDMKVKLIEFRKKSAERELNGLVHQLKAVQKQLFLSKQEFETVADLYAKKLSTKGRMLELEREMAERDGEIGALEAEIGRMEQTMLSADIEVVDLQSEHRRKVLEELNESRLAVEDLDQKIKQTNERLSRTVIRAPVSGLVLDLKVHTRGAVIKPGEQLMEIVPNDDSMVIAARVKPTDIDLVAPGGKAKVQLSAYRAKSVPRLDATVTSVSADIFEDERTGEPYFEARLVVDDQLIERLREDVALYPGMPADVFLLAGKRTVADYLVAPIMDATYRAFREE